MLTDTNKVDDEQLNRPLLEMKGLRIEGLSETGWQEIVRGVNLHLKRGEILGLIGESGAGKSTIGLAAMGYARDGCRITEGDILFDGIELSSAPENEKRKLRGTRISYVAQSAAAAFNPVHRLLDQFAEGPIEHGVMSRTEAMEKGRALYRSLDLPDPENIGERWAHQVSGGQLQRMMVAMAMSCGPDLIIFDEPTTALDVTTQIEVLKTIKEIVNNSNVAALYITHDLAVVAQLADHLMVLRHGNLVEVNSTGQILEAPKEDYTRALLDARTRHEKTAVQISDAETLLSINSVTAGYGNGSDILQEVSVSVERGRTVAVVGESGSGKSTLARVITGLLPQRSGEIHFQSESLPSALAQRSKQQLRKIQMIYQLPDVALNPRQRVRDILGRPLNFYLGLRGKECERRIIELLEQIELSETYIDRLPDELSGGEKQRICIARALAAEPELIICDEVTSALDTIVAKAILDLLQRLQHELLLTYLFISHDIDTVASIADQVVVLYAGRVAEQGSKLAVFQPPFHPYTQLLLSSVPEMKLDWLEKTLSTREAQAGIAREVKITERGCPFVERCPEAIPDICVNDRPPLQTPSSGHLFACQHSPQDLT
ncbi:MAG: ABC transporter ATP-binding protein [SAR324 cluster bacterium]|jgi:peptide/nickel transport system ATP-binding protein|nr:ABC transporter ATP-binding protein [Deltaproteobacteria bacterium]MDG1178436.1 ABC transporter ATP-binding protein [SAR324 cluster bacterium]MDG2064573.1 ABC transporter ATP-binding protein [SAR324 cluster bacterium]